MTVRQMEQLRALLQYLALPVTGQVRFMPDDCGRMEELAGCLRRWRQGLPAHLAADLSPGQKQVLLGLERQLARVCQELVSPTWTETAMRQSDGLRRARWLARQALVRFGWSLALPNGQFTKMFAAGGPTSAPPVPPRAIAASTSVRALAVEE